MTWKEQLMKPANKQLSYGISGEAFSISKSKFCEMVDQAKDYIRQGELFQLVFSNILKAGFSGDPVAALPEVPGRKVLPHISFIMNWGEEQSRRRITRDDGSL